MGLTSPKRPLRVGMLAYGLDRPQTGIGRYAVELTRTLVANHSEIEVVLLQPFADEIIGLEGIPRVQLPGSRLLPAMMTLGAVEVVLAALRHRLDVVHDPIGIAPFVTPRRRNSWSRVVTIHDAVPFVYPETHDRFTNFLFRRYMPLTLRGVDRVVTVSDASKRDLERFFRLQERNVVRVYLGVDQRFHPQSARAVEDVCARHQLRRPYILAVGALQARKNLEVALEAFALLKQRGAAESFVLVGPTAWKSRGIFQQLEALGLDDAVRLTGYVEDADLPAVYAGASCFVFPSLYEGFGLPPLEAMACGTPVVASNAAALPEVVGDAGMLIDPSSIEDLADAIAGIVSNPALASALREKGLVRSRRFTWAGTAAAHARLYQELTVDASRS